MTETRDLVAERIQAAIDACKTTPGRHTSIQEQIDNKITGGLLQEVLENHSQRRAHRQNPTGQFIPKRTTRQILAEPSDEASPTS